MSSSYSGVIRTSFTFSSETKKKKKKNRKRQYIWNCGFEDTRHQTVKNNDPKVKESKWVSLVIAPAYNLKRALMQRCRVGTTHHSVETESGELTE